jgi:hypothetical protein
LLTENNGFIWAGRGKLFAPSEIELYGCPIFSASSTGANNNAARGPYKQFPVFKKAGAYGRLYFGRMAAWSSSVAEGSSAGACAVGGNGDAYSGHTSSASVGAFACFHMG